MKDILKKALYSFLVSILIVLMFIFLYTLIGGREEMISATIGMAIISTVIFCTLTILDSLKEVKRKLNK